MGTFCYIITLVIYWKLLLPFLSFLDVAVFCNTDAAWVALPLYLEVNGEGASSSPFELLWRT